MTELLVFAVLLSATKRGYISKNKQPLRLFGKG